MSTIKVRDTKTDKIYRTFDPDYHNVHLLSLYQRGILKSSRFRNTGAVDASLTIKPLRKDLVVV